MLVGADWTILWTSILFGLLTGWLLAIMKQPAWWAAWETSGLALIATLLFVGGLGSKLLAVINQLILLGWQDISSWSLHQAGWQTVASQSLDLYKATLVIFERVSVWFLALAGGQPAFDPVAAALVWSALVWLIAAWAGWLVEARRNTLLASLPAILLSAATLSYARRTAFVLYLMLGALLLLLATVQHEQRELSWDSTGMAYPKRKGRQIGFAAALASIGLVVLAAILSSLSFSNFTNWLASQNKSSQSQDSGLAKSLGIVPAATATPDAFDKLRQPGLPRDLLIGSGPELSEKVVMSVEVNNLAGISLGDQALPLYWRSFTYDVYTGRGWQTSATEEQAFPANQPLIADQAADHVLIQQTVRPLESTGGML